MRHALDAAEIDLAHAPVVLARDARALVASLFICALVEDERAALAQLGCRDDLVSERLKDGCP